MLATGLFSMNLEWPAPGARVAGPVLWLRGWLVGHGGCEFVDVRARTAEGIFLGVLGLPRADLAAHFAPHRRWLPAEFVAAVPAADGDCRVHLEAQDAHGNWIALQTVGFTVAADGAANPRTEGRFIPAPGGGSVERAPHLPLHGHLDDPADGAPVVDGALEAFGWFIHEHQPIVRVSATLDTRTFTALARGPADDALARKVPHLPAARDGRVRGTVPCFATHPATCCLRAYVELADGTVQLALARRVTPRPAEPASTRTPPAPQGRFLPHLPSGRPRRLLIGLRTLHPDDATLRALDVVAWLVASGRWAVRAAVAEDGPLNGRFESAGCAVQQVDLRAWSAARGAAAEAELGRLEREIWWPHLDAVAVFDAASSWMMPLAKKRGLPVFPDPAAAIAWHPPVDRLIHDVTAPCVAPIRAHDRHGAPVLLAAAQCSPRDRTLVVSDARQDDEEDRLRAAAAGVPRLVLGPAPARCAALVCPAWRDHPRQTLLQAAISGVPVITTPDPLLAEAFAGGEMTFIPPGNPLALAHALSDLDARPEAAQRRAAAARRVAAAQFDPAAALPRWCAALEAAVGSGR
jgi:glycosyltransferase involved in cell wall biosynthesis